MKARRGERSRRRGKTRAKRRRAASRRGPAARRRARRTIANAIGKYRIVGPLGYGGMGTVYQAIDTTLGRHVAIKAVRRERADRRVIDRFLAEATTLARLNHPEIATIYDLVRSRRDLLLVMELVRGETLESVCRRMGVLPPLDAASLVDKLLSALEYAHAAGVVHCDVKPANVMVTEGGAIKIMDFGTARVRGAAAGPSDGWTVGTPAYMSPEQLLGDEVDARADLYAVGVVLYRLLAGMLPFDGDTALAVAQQHVGQPPAPLQTHRAGLPDWCDAIVRRALAKSPADRFQTAREFREGLRHATGLTAAELAQPCAISVRVCDAPARPRVQARPRGPSPAGHRAASTLVLNGAGRTASMFRGVGKRRRRHTVSTSGRALAVGALAAALMGAAAMLVVAPPRLPSAIAEGASTPPATPIVLQAKAVDASRRRPRDTTCRIALFADRIRISASDTNRVVREVPYDEVASVSRSGRDRVTLRTTKAKSESLVFRFASDDDARNAVAAIEERLPTSARETRESTR